MSKDNLPLSLVNQAASKYSTLLLNLFKDQDRDLNVKSQESTWKREISNMFHVGIECSRTIPCVVS